jgi:hypothetical protein
MARETLSTVPRRNTQTLGAVFRIGPGRSFSRPGVRDNLRNHQLLHLGGSAAANSLHIGRHGGQRLRGASASFFSGRRDFQKSILLSVRDSASTFHFPPRRLATRLRRVP